MFQFTSLLGAQSESQARQSLLTLGDGLKILVDVGWDESFDVEQLKEIARFANFLAPECLAHRLVTFWNLVSNKQFISHLKIYSEALTRPPHTPHYLPHRCLRPLLQTHPSLRFFTSILNLSYFNPRQTTPSRPLPLQPKSNTAATSTTTTES